jgi:hypothetical protein
MFCGPLITIFPISLLLIDRALEATDVDAVAEGNWATGKRPIRAPAGVYTEWR